MTSVKIRLLVVPADISQHPMFGVKYHSPKTEDQIVPLLERPHPNVARGNDRSYWSRKSLTGQLMNFLFELYIQLILLKKRKPINQDFSAVHTFTGQR